jgi:predicted nucleic acid-binding protein
MFLRMYLSSVVLYELMATNIDESTFAEYSSWKQAFRSNGKLLTPTATDWFECSKLVRNMLRGTKSRTKGTVAKITSAQQQQNDALIARAAVQHDCFVVTDNVRDFEKFQPYMKDLVIVPADYFFD